MLKTLTLVRDALLRPMVMQLRTVAYFHGGQTALNGSRCCDDQRTKVRLHNSIRVISNADELGHRAVSIRTNKPGDNYKEYVQTGTMSLPVGGVMNDRRHTAGRTRHSLAILVASGVGGLCPDLVHLLGQNDTVEQSVITLSVGVLYIGGLWCGIDYARLP
jgi:hypothetical protein